MKNSCDFLLRSAPSSNSGLKQGGFHRAAEGWSSCPAHQVATAPIKTFDVMPIGAQGKALRRLVIAAATA